MAIHRESLIMRSPFGRTFRHRLRRAFRQRHRRVGEKWRIDISSDIKRGMSYWRRGVKVDIRIDIKGEREREF